MMRKDSATSCVGYPLLTHTHDKERGLCVPDVTAVASDAGVGARVLRGHIMDHQGAILEDVHPVVREATAVLTWSAPREQPSHER